MHSSDFRSIDKARSHPLVSDRPASNFFQGALLGIVTLTDGRLRQEEPVRY